MLKFNWPVLLFALLFGCVGTDSNSKTPDSKQPTNELDPIVIEAADLIGEAVTSCEHQLLNGWRAQVKQYVGANWQDIQAAVPTTTPVQLDGGTLVAFGTSRHEDFFQSYALNSGIDFSIAVTDFTTFASFDDGFTLLYQKELIPSTLDRFYTSRFECKTKTTNVFASVDMKTESEWLLHISDLIGHGIRT